MTYIFQAMLKLVSTHKWLIGKKLWCISGTLTNQLYLASWGSGACQLKSGERLFTSSYICWEQGIFCHNRGIVSGDVFVPGLWFSSQISGLVLSCLCFVITVHCLCHPPLGVHCCNILCTACFSPTLFGLYMYLCMVLLLTLLWLNVVARVWCHFWCCAELPLSDCVYLLPLYVVVCPMFTTA